MAVRLAAGLLAFLTLFAAAHAQGGGGGGGGGSMGPSQLSTCRSMLDAVGINPSGNTFFCPTNEAFKQFADYLGYPSTDALLDAAKKDPALYRDVMQYHTVSGMMPASNLRVGSGMPTLLRGAAPMMLERSGSGGSMMMMRDDAGLTGAMAGRSDRIVGTDLTFRGRFDASKDDYVVHAIDRVRVPAKVARDMTRLHQRRGAINPQLPSRTAGRKLRA